MRYLGSKARIAKTIIEEIGPARQDSRFVDLFCGTGAVAETAANLGWSVHVNDMLSSAVVQSRARLTCADEAQFEYFGGYSNCLKFLNEIPPKRGFVTVTYTPASLSISDVERKYFTESNGARIDAVRQKIHELLSQGLVSEVEATLLLADLLESASSVANTSGTFGYFHRNWSSNSLKGLILVPRNLREVAVNLTWSIGDAFDFLSKSSDVTYVDPPYTKRQYGSYYHVLETITLDDNPQVSGLSGLRDWKNLASPFSYKTKAQLAFEDLVSSSKSQEFYFSYSSQGLLPIPALEEILKEYGTVQVKSLKEITSYSPNAASRVKAQKVTEYLIHLRKVGK
jgi:adenine-specific DNA-methyltransferase